MRRSLVLFYSASHACTPSEPADRGRAEFTAGAGGGISEANDMKLYLSSFQIGNAPERLIELLGTNRRVAIVMNAADHYGDSRRAFYFNKFAEEFAALGLVAEEVDLRKYFGKPEALESELQRFGLIWVTGGNTFVLRRAMAAS